MKKNTFLLMAGMLMFSSVAYASTKEYKFVQKESNGTVKSSKTVTLGTGEGYSEDAYMKWNNKLSGRGSCAGDGLKASNTTITCTCKSGYKWNSGLTDCVQGTPSQSTGSTSTSSTTTASVSSANFNYTLIKRDAYSIELKSTESSTRATLKDETDALNKKFKDYAWCAGNSSQYGYQIQCEMSNKQSFWNKDRCKNFISDLNGKGDVTSSCSKVVSGKDYYKFECVSPYTFDSTNKECQATFTIRYVDNVASDPQSLKLNVHPLDTPSDQCPGGTIDEKYINLSGKTFVCMRSDKLFWSLDNCKTYRSKYGMDSTSASCSGNIGGAFISCNSGYVWTYKLNQGRCTPGTAINGDENACKKYIKDMGMPDDAATCEKTDDNSKTALTCNDGYNWDNSSGICKKMCSDGYVWNNSQCVAGTAFDSDINSCQKYVANNDMTFNVAECKIESDGKVDLVCKDGFTWDDKQGKCVHGITVLGSDGIVTNKTLDGFSSVSKTVDELVEALSQETGAYCYKNSDKQITCTLSDGHFWSEDNAKRYTDVLDISSDQVEVATTGNSFYVYCKGDPDGHDVDKIMKKTIASDNGKCGYSGNFVWGDGNTLYGPNGPVAMEQIVVSTFPTDTAFTTEANDLTESMTKAGIKVTCSYEGSNVNCVFNNFLTKGRCDYVRMRGAQVNYECVETLEETGLGKMYRIEKTTDSVKSCESGLKNKGYYCEKIK